MRERKIKLKEKKTKTCQNPTSKKSQSQRLICTFFLYYFFILLRLVLLLLLYFKDYNFKLEIILKNKNFKNSIVFYFIQRIQNIFKGTFVEFENLPKISK